VNNMRMKNDEVKELYLSVLGQIGVPKKEIEVVVDAAVFASLRGIDTHGFIPVLTRAVKEIKAGIVKPNAKIQILKEDKDGALIDANMSLGPVSGLEAMGLAIKKAQEGSVAIVVVRNCNHFGAASYYAARALEKDMIGVVFCNASPTIAPFGGRKGVHGTNPMSFAIPAGKYSPIILDISTSAVARGKVLEALGKGEKIPNGWALDRNGSSTTDPKAALEGIILPMGGHKGYGLGLVVDVFTAALAGSLIAKEIPPYWDLATPYGASYFMMAIHVESFVGVEQFKHKVDRLIRDCKSCPPMEGFKEVLMPGEIEFREAQKRGREGVPVEKEQWQDMMKILKLNEIEVDSLLVNRQVLAN